MNSHTHPDMVTQIIEQAKAFGASLAGIASVALLKNSPSYEIYHQAPYYKGYEKVEWSVEARSVLVLALFHDPSQPELDWWDYGPGRTRGNRRLMSISESLKEWLDKEFGINARLLWRLDSLTVFGLLKSY